MSTKIYDGMIMTDTPSLYVLHQRMSRLRKTISEKMQELFLRKVAGDCTEIIDRLAMGRKHYSKDTSKHSIYANVWFDITQRYHQIEKTMERDPECDYYCEIVVLPLKNKYLIMPFCERPEILNIIRGQRYIRPYGYWNNTDPDSSVSEKEWNQREEDWNEALGDDGIPSQHGITIQLAYPYPHRGLPVANEVLQYVPSFRDRVKSVTREEALSLLLKQWKYYENKEPHSLVNMVIKARAYIKETDEGKRLLARMRKKVAKKLPRKITTEHLKIELKPNPKATKSQGVSNEL